MVILYSPLCVWNMLNLILLIIMVGYAYEELSEVSPDHRFIAYTMYDKDNDYFRLSVKNLSSGSLCSKPQVDRVSNLAWAKGGQSLLYVVTDQNKRPCRLVHLFPCTVPPYKCFYPFHVEYGCEVEMECACSCILFFH